MKNKLRVAAAVFGSVESTFCQMDLARGATLAACISIPQPVIQPIKLSKTRTSPQGVRAGPILNYAQHGDEQTYQLLSPHVVRPLSP